jgi:hypothetical protein
MFRGLDEFRDGRAGKAVARDAPGCAEHMLRVSAIRLAQPLCAISSSGVRQGSHDVPALRMRRLSSLALTASHALVYSLSSALHSHPGRCDGGSGVETRE